MGQNGADLSAGSWSQCECEGGQLQRDEVRGKSILEVQTAGAQEEKTGIFLDLITEADLGAS